MCHGVDKAGTLSLWGGSVAGKPVIAVANDLRTLLFIAAFVSIGLEFRAKVLKTAGWRPVGVFAAAAEPLPPRNPRET